MKEQMRRSIRGNERLDQEEGYQWERREQVRRREEFQREQR
jgi:hypothetical protein